VKQRSRVLSGSFSLDFAFFVFFDVLLHPALDAVFLSAQGIKFVRADVWLLYRVDVSFLVQNENGFLTKMLTCLREKLRCRQNTSCTSST
jgi:hypothetical protein